MYDGKAIKDVGANMWGRGVMRLGNLGGQITHKQFAGSCHSIVMTCLCRGSRPTREDSAEVLSQKVITYTQYSPRIILIIS